MGLLRRPTPGEIVEGGRLGRPCGPGAHSRALEKTNLRLRRFSGIAQNVRTSGIRLSGYSANPSQGRPPSPWSGRRPGSASAAPPPAGPGGWHGSAWGIVAAELGAQADQQPGPNLQQPVTAGASPSLQTARTTCWSITPGPRTRPAAQPHHRGGVAVGPVGGPGPLGAMADRAGGGHRFLLAALQEHLPAAQGRRAGQGRGPVDALGRLLDVLGHRHHQVMVVPPPCLRRGRGYPGGGKTMRHRPPPEGGPWRSSAPPRTAAW